MPASTGFPGLTQTQINVLIAAYAAPSSHNHAASAITSGQLALARGGTAADLAATGGATHFLRQASVGAALTVGGIVSADLTTALTTPPAIGGTTPAAGTFTQVDVPSGSDYIRLDHSSGRPRLTLFDSGIINAVFTTTAGGTLSLNAPLAVTGVITSTGLFAAAGLGSGTPGSATVASIPSGSVRMAPPLGSPAYLNFVETGGSFRGSIGFASGSNDLVYESGGNGTWGTGTERFRISSTGVATHLIGTAGSLSSVVNAAVIGRNDTGTPLSGFGVEWKFTLKSSTTNDRASGYIRSLWNDPANVAAIADLVLISAHNANGTVTERVGLCIRGGASATQLGFFGATPVAKPALGTWAGLTTDQKLDALRDAMFTLGLASYV